MKKVAQVVTILKKQKKSTSRRVLFNETNEENFVLGGNEFHS